MGKLTVMASGTGSLLRAMIEYPLNIEMVIVDRPCKAQEIAQTAGIKTHLVPRAFDDSFDEAARDAYSQKIAALLKNYDKGDVVAMAGFMTILSPSFFDAFHGIILNTHPSLLPLFKGHDAVGDALKAGAIESGCTIHIATQELDAGPILAQERVPVLPGDTKETLHERIKEAERALYPRLVADLIAKS